MRRDNQSEGLIMRICAEPGSSLGSGERSEVSTGNYMVKCVFSMDKYCTLCRIDGRENTF